ncbi:MAG TPA: DUF4912 domain-containing protein [Chthoniobacterales bacterium]
MSLESTNNPVDFRLAPKPVVEHGLPEEANDYVGTVDPATRPEFEELGNLPARYDQIFLVARDPHWLFLYWDFDYTQLTTPRRLALRVFCNGQLEATVSINELARNWYIPVQQADASYRVDFGYFDAQDEWHGIAGAGPARTPPESVSDEWKAQFATVPLHLSFNLLLNVVEAAQASGQPLTEALSDLQRGTSTAAGSSSDLHIDHLKVLETLLGKGLLERLSSLSSGALSSKDVTEFLRRELESNLDSSGASELLARGRLAAMLAPAETSLFSGALQAALAAELSSGGVSSFGAGSELSSGGLSSAGASAELSSGGLASWSGGAGSESLTSWQHSAVGSLGSVESSGLLSSFIQALGQGEWSSLESLSSSALSGQGASEMVALSSETLTSGGLAVGAGASEQALSSELQALWSGLELSSWTGLSSESSLSSGFNASWENHPFGQRGFFMHVNAEVIFYGGTDPRARVFVGGQPVALQPDGTFRYHFRFPDQEFEIPIVAVSPDNQETRTAVLSFRRTTERVGEVGATGQPPHLTNPMGAKGS